MGVAVAARGCRLTGRIVELGLTHDPPACSADVGSNPTGPA